MPLPSRSQCLIVMDEAAMPENIRRHSIMVADVALLLARTIRLKEPAVDVELVEAGALLHDLGKAQSIETGENHAKLGAMMVADLGYVRLAPIVRDHTMLKVEQLDHRIDESLLVNYADKRVKHDELVSLTDRFEDLADRYCLPQSKLALFNHFLDLYIQLEKAIFAPLPFGPEEVSLHIRAK